MTIPVKKINDIPQEEHLAILVQNEQTVHHEGDERSRTHPGHGYPAYTETITSFDYIPFENIEEVKRWIEWNKDRKKTYRVITVTPMVVKETVIIELE